MRQRHVPVTMGSPAFRTTEAGDCVITEAWFPPNEVLHPHTHDRAIVAVMLDGAFESAIARRRIDCPPASVWTEPLAERHANFIGREGAHVLVIQPDPTLPELFRPFTRLLEEVSHQRHAGIVADARRIVSELDIGDSASALAIAGLVMTILASAARGRDVERERAAPPRWLVSAQELLHEHFREHLELRRVAAAVGVHPSHLARTFHARFQVTMGSYVRRLRVDWAADRLARSDSTLSEVALAAGFSDQSHFTREFKKQIGLAPAAYRVARCGRRTRAAAYTSSDPDNEGGLTSARARILREGE